MPLITRLVMGAEGVGRVARPQSFARLTFQQWEALRPVFRRISAHRKEIVMRPLVCLAAAGLALGGAPDASAHSHRHKDRSAHQNTATDTPATREFKAAHEGMMRNVSLPYTGDPDVDFRVQMIPHHQGAIDMARVALRHAKDPWTRQLAEAVIVEQQREIAEMQAWLSRRGVSVPTSGQPQHVMGANSYRRLHEDAGTQSEAIGQSWAPGSGVPGR
jgi:hypothetical protein